MKKSVVWIESRWFHKTDISASPLSVSCHTRSVFNSIWPYFARDHTRPDISLQIFPLFSVLTVEVTWLLTVEVSPAGNLRWQLYIRNLRWRRGFAAKFAGHMSQEVLFKISCWMLYNVWSSFLEVRLWERRRRYQPIQSLRRRSPENTGTGDEEVPLSHSLNFSSIVVFVRPSSSFSNSLSLSSILRPNEGR